MSVVLALALVRSGVAFYKLIASDTHQLVLSRKVVLVDFKAADYLSLLALPC